MQDKSLTRKSFSRQIRTRLGDKWTVPVIDALLAAPLRFGELCRQVGAAPKVLTAVLRSLERDGLIERTESRTGGLHVQYALSGMGRAFRQLVDDIDVWSRRHEPRIAAARRVYAPPASRSTPVDAPAPTPAAGLVPSHICIPVRDIDRAIRSFASVLGVDPSRVVETSTALQPGRGRERIRICWFAFPNLLVELIQQMRGSGPFNDFLDGTGPGVAHIGVDVAPEWHMSPDVRKGLGLKITERPEGLIHRADIDLGGELGTDIHILAPMLRQTADQWLPSMTDARSLASQPVSRIGIVVPNVMRADRVCSKLMRIIDPSARQPGAFRYRYTEDATIATCANGGIAIDLIQPLHGPLRDHLMQHGPGVHHIGFNAQPTLKAALERLDGSELHRTIGFQFDITV